MAAEEGRAGQVRPRGQARHLGQPVRRAEAHRASADEPGRAECGQLQGATAAPHARDLVRAPRPDRRPYLLQQVGCDLNDSNVITKIKPDTPSGRADLKVGDQIIEVDGEALAGKKVSQVLRQKALHTFTILRSGK